MFSEFSNFFSGESICEESDNPYLAFLKYFGGRQTGNGLFKIFKQEKLPMWHENVTVAYPQFSEEFKLFAYDWLGALFCFRFKN